jgi:hypothetical protein
MPDNKSTQEQMLRLMERGCAIVNYWETNQLAKAVNELRQTLVDLGCATDDQGNISTPKDEIEERHTNHG